MQRFAKQFGFFFSVRDRQLTFTSLFDIDEAEAVATLDKSDISSYSFTDKLIGTYKEAEVAYRNASTDETIKAIATGEIQDITADDTLQVRTKAEDRTQADQKAKTALYRANSEGQTGRLSIGGNPILLAGNTVRLSGFGALNGKYRIESSSHSISGGSAYMTSLEVRRVGA